MKIVQRIGEFKIIDYAGCFIIHKGNERVGGLFATENDARTEVIEMERERLGIHIRERR